MLISRFLGIVFVSACNGLVTIKRDKRLINKSKNEQLCMHMKSITRYMVKKCNMWK